MYQKDGVSIWEVDGAKERVRERESLHFLVFGFVFSSRVVLTTLSSFVRSESQLYCQNLSLFGKLFIDQKTIFYSVSLGSSRFGGGSFRRV